MEAKLAPKQNAFIRGGERGKKMDEESPNDELRPEYDETLLKNGVRGKYADRYASDTKSTHIDHETEGNPS